MPSWMLLAPGQTVWPPLRTAKLHSGVATRAWTVLETSSAFLGWTIAQGFSWALCAQYEAFRVW